MPRLLFEKRGNAVWISHLDLMRLFQRAFKRAGLPLTHTQGFNPRPSVSIALPLSVGVESQCELLDFELDGASVPCDEICARLNASLISGVRVLAVYQDGQKLKHLQYLDCTVLLQYDRGVEAGAGDAIRKLFAQESLLVSRKSKNGIQEQDIIPMIKAIRIEEGAGQVVLRATISCQNPSLNPTQLAAAVAVYLPNMKPDHVVCTRIELWDADGNIFR